MEDMGFFGNWMFFLITGLLNYLIIIIWGFLIHFGVEEQWVLVSIGTRKLGVFCFLDLFLPKGA